MALQGTPQQRDDSPGQPHSQQQDHPENGQRIYHDHLVLGPDIRGEDGGHYKADDLSLMVFHRMERPALGPVGPVAGGDIGLAALQDGGLLPFHKGLAALLAIRVVEAQAVGIVDHNDIQVRHIFTQAVQLLGHFRVWIAPLQHIHHPVQLGDVGGAAADGLVHGVQLPVDIHIQHDTNGQQEQHQ